MPAAYVTDLVDAVHHRADRSAIGSGARVLTFWQAPEEVWRLARALRELGVKRAAGLACVSGNRPETLGGAASRTSRSACAATPATHNAPLLSWSSHDHEPDIMPSGRLTARGGVTPSGRTEASYRPIQVEGTDAGVPADTGHRSSEPAGDERQSVSGSPEGRLVGLTRPGHLAGCSVLRPVIPASQG
ncbi:hypothetical protein GCM10010339_27450 [Streptomyces alanosinicus]|uniref:Uncharacterized protein n=1 Tax=Streptomyces alanosinicus TaxID=68171 RepID=A0A919D2H3_9ACTN|nr:hypothetical protein GCM10010339_27450 [Streptomyces alanosinicus]